MKRSATCAAVLTLALALPSPSAARPQVAWEWPRATPADTGLNPAPIEAFDSAVRAGRHGHVDRLVVAHGGKLVADLSYENDYREISRGHVTELGCGWESCGSDADLHDFNYLHPDFHPWHQGRPVHSLQSVTKSISSTVIGIAIGLGAIESVDVRLLSFFDDYDVTGVDPRLHEATLADLLTMRSGIEWHEQDRPLDSTNTTLQLERSDDWVQFTLDQPMDAAPGAKWVYNSGGSHLMSAIIREATGMTIAEYAEEHLFAPLGIEDYYWKHTPQGLPDTEGGLYLDADDLAKIGLLMLQDGSWYYEWDGVGILPSGWVEEATRRHVDRVNGAGWGYGYQWWRPDTGGVEIWAAMGFGDQYLLILPEHDLVIAANSWNLIGRVQVPVLRGLIDMALALAGS